MTFLEFIPRWVMAAAIAGLAAMVAAAGIQIGALNLEIANHETTIAKLEGRIETARADKAEQELAFAKQARAAEQARSAREKTLVADATRARAESVGLRDDVAKLRDELDTATREAAIERAVAIANVLKQCASRHQDLAQRCDKHVSDIRTLMDAWPQNPPKQSASQ